MGKMTIDDLRKIKEKHKATFTLREGGYRAKITVHMGTCGIAAGARGVMDALVEDIGARGINDVIVATSGCAGFCSKEPMATVEVKDEAPVKYFALDAEKIKKIVQDHIIGGTAVQEYVLVVGSETSY